MKLLPLCSLLFLQIASLVGHAQMPQLSIAEQQRQEFLNAPATNEITAFETDQCSNFPDGTVTEPKAWAQCCVNHDKAYWMGGSKAKKELADNMLRDCVASTGHPNYGKIMKFGVRLFGGPLNDTPYRWGYGWSYPIGYSKPNSAQLESIKTQIELWESKNLQIWVPFSELAPILLPETD